MGSTQTGVLKPAHYVLSSHMFQSLSQGVVGTGSRSGRNATEGLLGLRPQLLDWGLVGTVGRQRQHVGPGLLDRCRHAGGQMGLEVVNHDDIASVQLRHPHHLRVGSERRCVGGARERQGCPHAVQAQRGDEGHRPPGSGHRADRTFTPWRPSVDRGPCRVDPGLTHKNQPFWLVLLHLLSESASLPLNLRPAALGSTQGLLLGGQTEAAQAIPDRRQRTAKAALLLQLLQRGVVLLLNQPPQPLLIEPTQGGSRFTAVWLGSQGAGLASPLEQPDDQREANAEPSGDRSLGAFPVIDGRRDPLTEIHRVGWVPWQSPPVPLLLPIRVSPSISIIAVCYPLLNRANRFRA